jgi:hypothetical protein
MYQDFPEYYYDYANLLQNQNGSLKDRMEIEQKYGSALDSLLIKRDADFSAILQRLSNLG